MAAMLEITSPILTLTVCLYQLLLYELHGRGELQPQQPSASTTALCAHIPPSSPGVFAEPFPFPPKGKSLPHADGEEAYASTTKQSLRQALLAA